MAIALSFYASTSLSQTQTTSNIDVVHRRVYRWRSESYLRIMGKLSLFGAPLLVSTTTTCMLKKGVFSFTVPHPRDWVLGFGFKYVGHSNFKGCVLFECFIKLSLKK